MEIGTLPKQRSPVLVGFLLFFGYLAIFFATWTINDVDYWRIGESAETLRLWYALPTLFGCAFLVVGISILGWWRVVLFDRSKAGPRWVWVLPICVIAIILNNFAGLDASRLSPEVLLWAVLGAVGVGFGEEMITRGSMVVGLRSRFPEVKVWLISSLLFSVIHAPNAIFGIALSDMAIQVVFTFIFGSGMYVMRRISGTLVLPMVLHGLWNSSVFLGVTTGREVSVVLFVAYPLSVICVIAVLLKERKAHVPTQNA